MWQLKGKRNGREEKRRQLSTATWRTSALREWKKENDAAREMGRSIRKVEDLRKNGDEGKGGGSVTKQLTMLQRGQRSCMLEGATGFQT